MPGPSTGTAADGVYLEKPPGSGCLGGRQEPCCQQHPALPGAGLCNRTPRDEDPEKRMAKSPSSRQGCETPHGDTHTALGTTTPRQQQRQQPLPSSVPKHEEEDAEDDARDADVDPNDDAGRGGFVVLLILHAVARRIQHCQKKGDRGSVVLSDCWSSSFWGAQSKSWRLGGAGSRVRGRGEEVGGHRLPKQLPCSWHPRKAVPASAGLGGP